jgi:hypothetical protein
MYTNRIIAFRNIGLDAAGVLEIEVHDLIVTVLGHNLHSLMLHITNILEQHTLVLFHIHFFWYL